jgi:hypothetical protein
MENKQRSPRRWIGQALSILGGLLLGAQGVMWLIGDRFDGSLHNILRYGALTLIGVGALLSSSPSSSSPSSSWQLTKRG